VTVRRKRQKYSKKDNPAVDFARRIRVGNDMTNPCVRHDNYNYNRYERITLGLNKFNIDDFNKGLFAGKFGFLREHVDTSAVSGLPVLILSVKEKASEINFRRDPKSEKETVTAINRVGLDDITDQESLQVFLEDIFREIDLYDNDINILQNRFVSPLSRIAPDFYKFFLTDTVEIDGERCVELSFTPHNTAVFGFTGQVYVPQGDTTMFVRRVDMHLPPRINLNFIDRLYIRQDYDRASDGTRLKTRDDFTAEMTMIPGLQSLYARRSTRYDGHNFDEPANKLVFEDARRIIIPDSAYHRPDSFWIANRGFEPATRNERRISTLVQGMRSVPVYYWGEKILKILVSGYVATTRDPKKSKIDIGPVNTIISHNEVEGYRLRAGGMTTANLSPHWFG
ncbi:MAG: carboxypeptidase-like regulatory domain-containing protein, partial [Muribaculaceae bacterium]|nr:carboxypeptidase-like regulatory domain-containing protein [Muribaculaceae bacterium]